MTSVANLQPDPAPIRACTISRDVQNFELLIDDMEAALGESWGDVQKASGAMERIDELMRVEPGIGAPDRPTVLPEPPRGGSLSR